jgi:hypothetical protein
MGFHGVPRGTNLAKLEEKIIEVERIEIIEDVYWTMNDQWIKLNGGGLLPPQNAQIRNSCTAFAVTALCMLNVLTLEE